MGTNCRAHGALRSECGCDRARELLAKLTAHTPTPAEVLDMEQGTDWPEHAPGSHTDGPVARSRSQTGNSTSVVSEAGRSPHSKPYIRADVFGPGWSVTMRCCDEWPLWPIKAADTWREAIDAALVHVAEQHTPKPCGRRDGTSDADLEAAWHFHNLQQWHNRQEQAS